MPRKPNGRSSIYQDKNGKWHGWVTVGIKPDGSLDRRHRVGKSEAEVTAKVRELEDERAKGSVRKAGRDTTLAQWMAEYLDGICELLVASGKMAPRTLEDYRSKSRLWIVPLLGKQRLGRLEPEHLEHAYAEMLRRGLSANSVLKNHRILSRALRIAMRRGRVARNVATLVEPPTVEEAETDVLTREEARRVLDVARLRRNGARWSVALALGIRQGEALGLRWSYVDLETGEIKAWYQVQRAPWKHGCADANKCGERWHRKPCKKKCSTHHHEPDCPAGCTRPGHACPKRPCPKDCVGHADRCPKRHGGGLVFRQRKGRKKLTLYCPPELLAILKKHKEDQDAERLKAGEFWHDHDLVFPTRRGTPIERTEDWREWKTILKKADVREVRVHDTRHTAGTMLIEQGVNIRVVQEVLGHTRVTTTERYTHVAAAQVQEAGNRMAAALWGEE